MARSVYQYEQPRCPDGWNQEERRFYNRLIETLDDIYAKYGRIDDRTLLDGVRKVESAAKNSLDKMEAGTVTAMNVFADSLSATFGYIASLSGKYGSFDFETVKNLVAQAMVLERGQADYIHITNLAATYAQAVHATIGNLCIQSSDGGYYQLDVKPDGTVSAEPVTVTEGEIAAGQTESGKVIVGTHITAETLGTETLAATQALVNTIDAARINVAELIARDAFIQALTASQAFIDRLVANAAFIQTLSTAKIVGEESITMIAERSNRSFRQEEMPAEGIKTGDTWRIPSTGQTYQAEDAGDAGLQFYLDNEGSVGYESGDESVTVESEGFNIAVKGAAFQDDGSTMRWALVRDDGMLSKEEFQHYVRVEPDGLHVGAEGTTGEVHIDHDSVDVVLSESVFTSLGSNYVELGNYQLRRTADGGLAFKMR